MAEWCLIACEATIIELELWVTLAVRMVIYQPQFFPRLHYFARILNADIYGVADNVQFVRKHAYHTENGKSSGPSYQAHTPIKTPQGVLLIDYATENGFKAINETRIVYTARNDKLRPLRLTRESYRKASRYRAVDEALHNFMSKDYETVADFNVASTLWGLGMLLEVPSAYRGEANKGEILDALRISDFRLRNISLLSETGVPVSNKEAGRDANDWLIDSCKELGASEYYYGGSGAAAYMDFGRFESAGISLKAQNWHAAPYRQLHGDFVANLSILDLLMNTSPEEARQLLHSKD